MTQIPHPHEYFIYSSVFDIIKFTVFIPFYFFDVLFLLYSRYVFHYKLRPDLSLSPRVRSHGLCVVLQLLVRQPLTLYLTARVIGVSTSHTDLQVKSHVFKCYWTTHGPWSPLSLQRKFKLGRTPGRRSTATTISHRATGKDLRSCKVMGLERRFFHSYLICSFFFRPNLGPLPTSFPGEQSPLYVLWTLPPL